MTDGQRLQAAVRAAYLHIGIDVLMRDWEALPALHREFYEVAAREFLRLCRDARERDPAAAPESPRGGR